MLLASFFFFIRGQRATIQMAVTLGMGSGDRKMTKDLVVEATVTGLATFPHCILVTLINLHLCQFWPAAVADSTESHCLAKKVLKCAAEVRSHVRRSCLMLPGFVT